MKPICYTLLLLFFSSFLHSQNLVIGCVKDTFNNPIPAVSIYQTDYSNQIYSDKNGYFHILVDQDLEKTITFQSHRHKSLSIHSIDTITQFQNIVLQSSDSLQNLPTYYRRGRRKKSFRMAMQMDLIFPSFDQFSDEIGKYNTDILNGFHGVINMELTNIYKRRTIGFGYGLLFSEFDTDSLDMEVIKTQWTLSLGYRVIDSRRFLFKPNVGVKWYKYRLLNYEKEAGIPLSQYLKNRDLDLRFNQATGYLGADIAFKIHPKNNTSYHPGAYWTVGFYGGYLFRLHKEPYLYARRNRIRTNLEIDLNNYNFGIFFTWNLDQ